MKSIAKKLFAVGAALAALAMSAHVYGDVYFSYGHGNGSLTVYTTGDGNDVGCSPSGPYTATGVPYSPATNLWCPFYNPNLDTADVRADVDTDNAVGWYDIGYFPDGGEAYLYLS